MCAFRADSANLEVFETPQEHSAWQRRTAARMQHLTDPAGSSIQLLQKRHKLNLNTFKFHAQGDYVSTIAQYGTTDLFSTQTIINFTDLIDYLH
jgi:hypothetical protein